MPDWSVMRGRPNFGSILRQAPFGSAQTGKRLLEPSFDTELQDEVQGRRQDGELVET